MKEFKTVGDLVKHLQQNVGITWIGDSVTTLDALTKEYKLTYEIDPDNIGDLSYVELTGDETDIENFLECADGLDLIGIV